MLHNGHHNPVWMQDSHVRNSWLLSDRQETQGFILFGFSCSSARCLIIPWPKGLINSYAGQLKHIGCDQFFITDSEVTQNAALDRGKTHSCLPSDIVASRAGAPGYGAGSD